MSIVNLKKFELHKEPISVPSWAEDGTLFIQEMSGRQLDTLTRYTSVVDGSPVMRHQMSIMIILSVVDADGKFIFTEVDIDDLEGQPASVLSNIVNVVNRVSGFAGGVAAKPKNPKKKISGVS